MEAPEPQKRILRDGGSFRDPSGYVFLRDTDVIRTVNPIARESFRQVVDSGVIDSLVKAGLLIGTEILSLDGIKIDEFKGPRGESPCMLLRHPKIPFISYPYEWTFEQLRDASLAHLQVQMKALDAGVSLSDATPFNMQFLDGKVVHMDVLSLKPYEDGEHWAGYNQFCRTFLLPLLIESWCGVSFQPMLRGNIEGISLHDAMRLLPKTKLWTSLNGIIHVAMHARIVEMANSTSAVKKGKAVAVLSKSQYKAILREMHNWIASLRSGRKTSYWTDYAAVNTYTNVMRDAKIGFISRWAKAEIQDGVVWDIGGNTGDYSKAALDAGAAAAIVFDSDLDSLERAYARRKQGLNILPVLMDLADPSPSQGWNQAERQGLNERTRPDGIMALAVMHHMVIGRNLPFEAVLDRFVSTAATGIIEFVPKTDPMVEEMLLHRQDVFIDYDEAHFLSYLEKRASILDRHNFMENGRLMVSYRRKT